MLYMVAYKGSARGAKSSTSLKGGEKLYDEHVHTWGFAHQTLRMGPPQVEPQTAATSAATDKLALLHEKRKLLI